MNVLFALLVGIVIFLGYMALTRNYAQRERARGRIAQLADAAAATYGGEGNYALEGETSGGAALLETVLSGLGTDIPRIWRERQMELAQAGIASYNGFVTYLFLKRIGLPLLAIIVAIPLFISFGKAVGMMRIAYLIGLVLVALIGIKGADLYVTNQMQKRKQKLMRAFPDTLDLLLVCVESGLALDGALLRVTRELGRAYPEITEELNRTRYELTLLNDRSQALLNLAERTDLVPFRSLVSALIQTEKFGTSLSDTLRVMSMDYRQTRLMEAENKAGRLPALMTIPMILLMLPAFMMIIIAPPIIRVAAQGGLFGHAAD